MRTFALAIAAVLLVSLGIVAIEYLHREDLQETLAKGCRRNQQNLRELLRFQEADRAGNVAVGTDPQQPPRTKRARLHEAHVQGETIATLRSHLTPAEGGHITCTKVYPPASFFN